MPESRGRIEAISISRERGTPKSNVREARLIEDWGIEGDAHAGRWHRQVSLLASEAVERMSALGAEVRPGAFAENLTIRGLDFSSLKIGDRLLCGAVELEITQIGKKCHNRCAIYEAVGDCVMPREGVFAKVIKGGQLSVGAETVRIAKEDE